MAKRIKKISVAEELKAYKAAKTPKEMVESWGLKLGGKADVFHEFYKVYEERATHLDIIKIMIQDPEINMLERNVLDPKAKELCKLALAVRFVNNPRVTTQVVAAKAEGATDAEIMDVVYIAAYGSAKSRLSTMGMAVREGYDRAKRIETKEKYEAARKAGKEGIMSLEEEMTEYNAAKTPEETLVTWWLWLGMSREDALKEIKSIEGPAKGFTIFEDMAPRIKMIDDMTMTPIKPTYARAVDGTGLPMKLRDYLMWILCAEEPCLGCLTAHVPFLYARGANEEEMIELIYLMCVEAHRAELERVGPALAEGFRQAEELGL